MIKINGHLNIDLKVLKTCWIKRNCYKGLKNPVNIKERCYFQHLDLLFSPPCLFHHRVLIQINQFTFKYFINYPSRINSLFTPSWSKFIRPPSRCRAPCRLSGHHCCLRCPMSHQMSLPLHCSIVHYVKKDLVDKCQVLFQNSIVTIEFITITR